MVELTIQEIILEYVVPGAGTIMATVMFAAPYGDLRRAVARGYLGSLNPTPWAFMLGNCFGWVTYSILQQDQFLLWANAPGFLLSVYLNLGAVKLLYQGHHAREMRKSLVAFLEVEQTKRYNKRSSDDTWGRGSVRLNRTSVSSFNLTLSDNNNGSNHSASRSFSNRKRASLMACAEDPTAPGFSRRGPRPSLMIASEAWAQNSRRGADGSRGARPSLAAISSHMKSSRRASLSMSGQTNEDDEAPQDWATLIWNVTSQTTPAPAPHENLVLFIVAVWTACIALICFADSFNFRRQELTVGVLVNLNLVFFYGAPLSTIGTVIKERNSSSIHIPTMITNTVTSSFWTAYGFALFDPFLFVPNGLGACLGLIQVVLTGLFPRTSNDPTPGPPTRLPLQDYPPCIRVDVLQRASEVGKRKQHAIMPMV